MTLLVTPVTTAEEMKVVRTLRLRVFIDEQGFEEDGEFNEDDDSPAAVHFLGKDVEQDEYVGVARVLVDAEKRSAKISRVALLPECRGKNYGLVLMNAIEDHVRDRVDSFTLSALYGRQGFYEKCGYTYTTGEIYVDEGAKQLWMHKPAQPPSTE